MNRQNRETKTEATHKKAKLNCCYFSKIVIKHEKWSVVFWQLRFLIFIARTIFPVDIKPAGRVFVRKMLKNQSR